MDISWYVCREIADYVVHWKRSCAESVAPGRRFGKGVGLEACKVPRISRPSHEGQLDGDEVSGMEYLLWSQPTQVRPPHS